MMHSDQAWTDRHFIVWGLGKTGTAMAHFLACHGAQVSVIDRAQGPSQATLELLGQFPIRYHWGGEEPATFDGCDAIILSPGVPYDLPSLRKARAQGIETVAAMQWAARLLDIPMVAVTGTAGKSTTVSLVGAMLKASGFATFVGGNIGTPLISMVPDANQYQRIVLECSSFQLEAAPDLGARVALLTNISDNHLDRHGTMAQYAACKGRLFAPLSPNAFAITWAKDDDCLQVLGETQAQRVLVHSQSHDGPGAAPTPEGFSLCIPSIGEIEKYDLQNFRLRGTHNRENAMMAALTARLAGASPAGIQLALDTFASLAHRLEEIEHQGKIRYYNDSKSTTPESTIKAIAAFDPVTEPLHLLLGGRSKGSDWSVLISHLQRSTKAVYLFGEAANEIAARLQDQVIFTCHPTMEDALLSATAHAQPGDCILLSPACASFDQFANFEARGDALKAWVHAHRADNAPHRHQPMGAP